MLAIDGPLWHSTNADWYHDKKKLFAEFAVERYRVEDDDDDDDEDEEEKHVERVVNVTIAGFDRYTDPMFSRKAGRPYFEKEFNRDTECSAPGRLLNTPAIFTLGALALISVAGSFLR